MSAEASLPVWDRGIRLFHWLLLLGVTAAAVSGFLLGSTFLRWHLIAGSAIAALLLWRVVWGALGGSYARFAGFAYPPRTVVAYLRAMRGGARLRYLGHNPLGALMVFALLLVLTAIVATGTITLGGMLKQGPLRAFLTYAVGRQVLGIHRLLGWLLLGMIAAHLAGVAYESGRERENLVGAMITGRKPAAPRAVAAAPARASRRAASRLTLGLGLGGAAAIAGLAALPGRGVPPATLDPAFAEQCGSCHLAFPPSLAPAATWNAILDRMHAHFGEDTGLPPAMIAQLRAYLDANAAEHWDTLPSWRLRTPDPGGSLRITATPGWRRIHRGIPAAVFAAPPVFSRSACEVCHADAATGLFAPQAIAIPRP
jgi:cytochrome b